MSQQQVTMMLLNSLFALTAVPQHCQVLNQVLDWCQTPGASRQDSLCCTAHVVCRHSVLLFHGECTRLTIHRQHVQKPLVDCSLHATVGQFGIILLQQNCGQQRPTSLLTISGVQVFPRKKKILDEDCALLSQCTTVH